MNAVTDAILNDLRARLHRAIDLHADVDQTFHRMRVISARRSIGQKFRWAGWWAL
jgi:hypothetical protein